VRQSPPARSLGRPPCRFSAAPFAAAVSASDGRSFTAGQGQRPLLLLLLLLLLLGPSRRLQPIHAGVPSFIFLCAWRRTTIGPPAE